MFSITSLSFMLSLVYLVMASPQFAGAEGSFARSASSASSGSSAATTDTTSASAIRKHNVVIAHAVLACVAWAFLFPTGGILLRLNINHPIILKLHIFCQSSAYIFYVAAAGLGIWLAIDSQTRYAVWTEPHVIIGLVIFIFATCQPLSGSIHHLIYRSRATAFAATSRGPRPSRTVWGRLHLWLGRILITLAIVNGGLGLRLVERSPRQALSITRNAEIGYGVAAGLMWCIYAFITVLWEVRKSARDRKQQYDDSRARIRGAKSEPQSPASESDGSLRQEQKLPA